METVKVTIKYVEKASRLELLIRIFWTILVGIVLWIVGMIAGILWLVEVLHVLLLGKRHQGMQKFIDAYVIAKSQLEAYVMLSTDERPPVIPNF